MKISIVMLAYNQERFIGAALESVLRQNLSCDYELIVGEDCSTDSTRAIVQSYESKFGERIFPVYRDKNFGMIKNLLDCLDKVQGEYIAFLEGDDYWLDDNKLEKQLSYMEANPDVALIMHDYEVHDARDQFILRMYNHDDDWVYDQHAFEQGIPFPQTSTWMIRKEVLFDLIRQFKRLAIRYAWVPMDLLTTLAVMSQGRIHVLHEAKSVYRYYIEENGSNWSSQNDIEAQHNYLKKYMFYLVAEKLSRKVGVEITTKQMKSTIFHSSRSYMRCCRGFRKVNLWLQGVAIFILEPHKIRFVNDYRQAKREAVQ